MRAVTLLATACAPASPSSTAAAQLNHDVTLTSTPGG